MKYLVAGLLTLTLMGCDGPITGVSDFPLQNPDFEYELDTYGFNSEIYEFTPKSNPNMTCVMMMLDSGAAMGLQCFPKAK